MTEKEWLASVLPGQMVWSLKDKATERKKCLLGATCLRRIDHFLPGPISKQAVQLLEWYADGQATSEQLGRMRESAMEEVHAFPNPHGKRLPEQYAGTAVYYSDDVELLMQNCAEATAWAKVGTPEAISGPEEKAQCKIIREIFGNPVRKVAIKRKWQTADVVSLAQAIYDERAFDGMPILGDALEDAGCDNAEILNHCRKPGEHVKGCWVVDLILGKK